MTLSNTYIDQLSFGSREADQHQPYIVVAVQMVMMRDGVQKPEGHHDQSASSARRTPAT